MKRPLIKFDATPRNLQVVSSGIFELAKTDSTDLFNLQRGLDMPHYIRTVRWQRIEMTEQGRPVLAIRSLHDLGRGVVELDALRERPFDDQWSVEVFLCSANQYGIGGLKRIINRRRINDLQLAAIPKMVAGSLPLRPGMPDSSQLESYLQHLESALKPDVNGSEMTSTHRVLSAKIEQ